MVYKGIIKLEWSPNFANYYNYTFPKKKLKKKIQKVHVSGPWNLFFIFLFFFIYEFWSYFTFFFSFIFIWEVSSEFSQIILYIMYIYVILTCRCKGWACQTWILTPRHLKPFYPRVIWVTCFFFGDPCYNFGHVSINVYLAHNAASDWLRL